MAEEHKRPSNFLIWVISSVIIVAVIFLLTRGCGGNLGGYTHRDTIYVPEYKEKVVTKYEYIERPNVTLYDTIEKFVSDIYVQYDTVKETKTIVVPGARDTIYVNTAFVTKHEKAGKLIQHRLWQDSMSYDLYYPDGSYKTLTYPLNLDKYHYVWEHDSLKVLKSKTTFRSFFKDVKGESYFYSQFNPINQRALLAVDYALYHKRFGFYGRLELRPFDFVVEPWLGVRVKLK